MVNGILKFIFLTVAITYSYSNTVKAIRKQSVSGTQMFLMGIGVAGFISLMFEWIKF